MLVLAVVNLIILLILKSNLSNKVTEKLTNAEKQNLSQLAKMVSDFAETADDLSKKMLFVALNTTKEVIKNKGGANISGTEQLKVINQFTKEETLVNAPRLAIGGNPIQIVTSFNQNVPIVDEVTKLSGATSTLFVRMNDRGDMLRVATTVKTKAGDRAVKTFIPAINPDGKPNPVVSAILNGEEYFGRAFVVDQWYVTAYTPLKTSNGQVIGMAYVGIPLKLIEEKLRKAIYAIKIGQTGYVYVLGATGESRGHYLISKDGKRDGENIWESKDANGKLFIQEIINQTVEKPGEILFFRYDWKNPEDPKPRTKIVAAVYYKDWDWVIGAGSYEDEIYETRDYISSSLNSLVLIMVISALILFVFIIFVGTRITKRIAQPITLSASIAEAISRGELDKANKLMK